MSSDDPRAALLRLAAERGESLAALSSMLRRNTAYLQQFVQRGSPRRLAEPDRRLLADHFGVDEQLLGGPAARGADTVAVPFLDVGVSAGPGAASDDERTLRHIPLAHDLLRSLGVAPADASLVTARGSSMAPGILDGDRLLVDRATRRVGAHGRVFVARIDDTLVVKRLSRDGGAVRIVSDNPAVAVLRRPAGEVAVLGRVKLLLREPA